MKRYLCRHLNSNIKVEEINEVVFKEVFTLAKVWHKNASKTHPKRIQKRMRFATVAVHAVNWPTGTQISKSGSPY